MQYKQTSPALVSLTHYCLLGEFCSRGSELVTSRNWLQWMAWVDIGIVIEIACVSLPETRFPSWATIARAVVHTSNSLQLLIFAYASNESQPDAVARISFWTDFCLIAL